MAELAEAADSKSILAFLTVLHGAAGSRDRPVCEPVPNPLILSGALACIIPHSGQNATGTRTDTNFDSRCVADSLEALR